MWIGNDHTTGDETAMGDSLSMEVWEKDVLLQDNVAEIVSCQSSARFVLEHPPCRKDLVNSLYL